MINLLKGLYMKALLFITILSASNFSLLMAKDLSPYEDVYVNQINNDYKESSLNLEIKTTYLQNLIQHQQKSYNEHVTYLESELKKTQERLLLKSLSLEKIEEAIKDKYAQESIALKKELVAKTKSNFELQRLIEKLQPSDDLKQMIKLNTDLASELRKSEDQIAFIQLKKAEEIREGRKLNRLPASVKVHKHN